MKPRDGKTYELNTANDFLAIPEDRFEKCLQEFTDGIRTAYYTVKATKAIAESLGKSEFEMRIPSMRWTDDDANNLTVNFKETVEIIPHGGKP